MPHAPCHNNQLATIISMLIRTVSNESIEQAQLTECSFTVGGVVHFVRTAKKVVKRCGEQLENEYGIEERIRFENQDWIGQLSSLPLRFDLQKGTEVSQKPVQVQNKQKGKKTAAEKKKKKPLNFKKLFSGFD